MLREYFALYLTFMSNPNPTVDRQSVSRRYSFPLRVGHKTAYLCTESTVYKYVDNLDAPKRWFKANADSVLDIYGDHHHIQKEDLHLGTLTEPATFVVISN